MRTMPAVVSRIDSLRGWCAGGVAAALTIGGTPVAATGSAGPPVPVSLTAESRDAALDCLAAAIGYEAGREPVTGQEAVAQVVLNRLHHPAFPKTVCGVVYQGAERRTGCQFTFACDGSLARRRSAATERSARVVAARVFDGLATGGIGTATFYHADYVKPYWAPALVRVAQIGAHIFYRFPGDPASPDLLSPGVSPAAAAGSRETVFSAWGLATLTVVRGHDGELMVRAN